MKLITIVTGVLIVLAFFYVAETSISFHPFAIQFKSLYKALAVFMLVCAMYFASIHYYNEGYREAKKNYYESRSKSIKEPLQDAELNRSNITRSI